jgi:hypothetical protein
MPWKWSEPSLLSKEPAFAGRLDIRRLGVAPAFSGRNLVYRMSEAAYETDFYNLFLVNPGEMVTQQVRDWVDRANLFAALTVPGSRLESDYTLEGQVVELYGDFEQGRGAAVITLQLFLVRKRNENPAPGPLRGTKTALERAQPPRAGPRVQPCPGVHSPRPRARPARARAFCPAMIPVTGYSFDMVTGFLFILHPAEP